VNGAQLEGKLHDSSAVDLSLEVVLEVSHVLLGNGGIDWYTRGDWLVVPLIRIHSELVRCLL